MKSKVYFTRTITSDKVTELYHKVGKPLSGNVAIKLHSGEPGNQNFLKPEFWKPVIEEVGGTVTECNTAYEGGRNTTEKHLETLKKHGWSQYFDVDLLDAEGPDMELAIPGGKMIKKNFVGKDLANYNALLVLSHFKGHPMGGYGGALKQLSIGIASSYGKAYIHGVGDPAKLWTADHDSFLASMADAASSVIDYFKGNAVYINVMKNMSVDCDCAGISAAEPTAPDIGILASTDLLAVDQASVDMVYALPEKQRHDLVERIESRSGLRQLEYMETMGIGHARYDLVSLS